MANKLLTYKDALVTDPAQKRVTDQSVKNHLESVGIAVGAVDFKYDYSREFPRSKMYQVNDPGSAHHGAHIVAISNLPMVNSRGEKCKPQWLDNGDGSYRAAENQFEAVVRGDRIIITRINDQPDGTKAGDATQWEPVLYFEGKTVNSISGPTVKDDLLNPNYKANTIEYDYGICKRRLRLIEGKFIESWQFECNPGGRVRVEHNFIGPKARLGCFAVDEDTEVVTPEQFESASEFPLTVCATGTFYPDRDPESTTMDAYLHNSPQNDTWNNIRSQANATGYGDSHIYEYDNFMATTAANNWKFITRTLMLFSTSSIGAGKSLQSATLSLFHNLSHSIVGESPATHICSSNPWSNTSVTAGDFSTFGTVSFGSILHVSWSAGVYNNIGLNAIGLAAINPTGITKMGVRSNYDLTGDIPPWSSEIQGGVRFYSADQGEGYKPKLVVVYVAAPAVTTDAASNVGATTTRLNGSVTATGDENPTRYFQFGKTGSYELGSINKGAGGVGDYYHDLGGLDPDTTYYFRAYAANSAGTGYGTQRTFTTLPPPGWQGKIGGITNPARVGGIDQTQIEKIGGVS